MHMRNIRAHVALAVALALGAPLAQAECGRISAFDLAPRSQQLHDAVIIAIDDAYPGRRHAHRVAPGRHRVTVAEAIEAHRFSPLQRVERDRRTRDRYKELVIDVQPGMTYRIAAKLHLDRRGEIRSNAYWDPVVWSEVAEACR